MSAVGSNPAWRCSISSVLAPNMIEIAAIAAMFIVKRRANERDERLAVMAHKLAAQG